MYQTTAVGTPSVSDRSTEFIATTGGAETTSAESLLITAYILMWLLVFGFVWASWRRQNRLDSRLDDLEKALASQNPESQNSDGRVES